MKFGQTRNSDDRPTRLVKDVTPKTRLKAQRGYVTRTATWPALVEHYRRRYDSKPTPMVRLVESLAASPASAELFGHYTMDALLLSDTPNFRTSDSTLRISYFPTLRQFEFHHQTFSTRDDRKTCAESEALQTLRLFLRLKFGVLYEPPVEPDTDKHSR